MTDDKLRDATEQVARALCRVTGADPDALGVDGNKRFVGWMQFARAAINALPSNATTNASLVEAHDIALKSLNWDSNPALVLATESLREDGYNNAAGYLSNYMAGRFLDAYKAALATLRASNPDEEGK